MNQSNAKPLLEVIGKGLFEIRNRSGKLQENIAVAARLFGLHWTRSTIAAIETSKRDLTKEELILLPSVVAAATGHALTLADFISNDRIQLSSEVVVHPGAVKNMLRGIGSMQADRDFIHSGLDAGREINRAKKLGLSRRELRDVENEAAADAMIKAARRLKMSPLDLALAARKTWGRSLPEERDRRLRINGADHRTIQARRGHITRQLLQELQKTA